MEGSPASSLTPPPPADSHFLHGSAAALKPILWNPRSQKKKKNKQQQNQLEKHCTTPNCCLLTVIKISTWLFQDGLLERHQDCCTHVMGLPGGPGGTGSMEVMHFHYSLSQHWARFVIACLSVFVYILPPSLDCAHSWRARTVSFFLPCGPAPSIKVSHNSLSTA